MSRIISADDARCQIQQAQAVLSLWLEAMTRKDGDMPDLIASVLTLLDGTPEAVDTLIGEVAALETTAARGKR